MPTQLRRQCQTCLSPLFHNAMQIVPHRLVGDALATFCQEECRIGLRIGEVRADAVFVDAHGGLSKWRKNRLANPFARAFGSFPIASLDAIVLVKEVAMCSQGIEMQDFI